MVEAVGPGVDHREGRRPRRLWRPDRRLCRSPADRRRQAGQTAGAISSEQAAAMMLQGMTAQMLLRQVYRGEVRRHDPDPCRRRRRRPYRLPMGEGAWRDGDRHRRQRREGRARPAHGCDHPIVYTRQDFVAEVERITDGAKLPVVYDSRRPGHLPEVARLPAPARDDGELRQCLRIARSVPAEPPGAEGLAVPDPADAIQLHRDARPSSTMPRRSCSRW